MTNLSTTYRLFLFFCCLLCSSLSIAQVQYPAVTANADRNEILIGEQIKVSLEAKFSNSNYKVEWPAIPDSFGHFEMVDRSKVDSVYSNGQLSSIKQVFTITSFDSGKWFVPSIKININSTGNNSPAVVYTDTLPVTVSFSVSDTTTQLRDIKPIRETAPETLFWYWAVGAILLLALIALIIWYFKKKKKVPAEVFKAKLSAYDEAMQSLQEMHKESLPDPDSVKLYHTKLTDIFRRYLSRKTNQVQMNKTTGDILLLLNDTGLPKTEVSGAAQTLRCSDAVKFAKYQPERNESVECLQSTKRLVDTIEKINLPQNT